MTTISQAVERERTRRSVLSEFIKHQGPGDHKGGTPQTTHGRGGRNASAATIKSETEGAGVTIRTMTGERPDTGFAVAMPDGLQLPENRASEKRIRGFIRDKWEMLSKPGNFLGTWNDTDKGVVWLDVVKVINSADYARSFEQALKLGNKNGEDAIYDLKNGVEIFLDDEQAISDHRDLMAAAA